MNLEGKIALITGGGKGIGEAIAKKFVADGARVCITGRSQEALDAAASSMPSEMVATCAGDVSDYEDVKRMVQTTVDFGGGLNVLVNNAGIDPAGSVADLDPEVWEKVLKINLTGPFLTIKASIPHMINAGGGSIINISSLGGLRCLPGMPAYASSKAGLIMLSKQVALDYGPQNIRCNAVCPGATRTKMLENSLSPLGKTLNTDVDGVFSHIAAAIPLRRVAQPEEITGICSYLASDESSFTTASVHMVDGGASVVDVSGATLSMAGIDWGVA
ncbi:MAG: SDR family oxidoreductase [Desulfobacteraceae bacterium]|nr:SDR family oxidoreductase [Desulfobacteraceae bacterium]